MQYILVVIGIMIIFILIQILCGKKIWHRLLAFNQLSTKITLSMVILGVMLEQIFLLDVAIVYTIFSFVSDVFIARFIRERGSI